MRKIGILTFKKNPIAAELFTLLETEYSIKMIYTEKQKQSFPIFPKANRRLRWAWYCRLFDIATRVYGVGHFPQPAWSELKEKYPNAFIRVDDHNSVSCRKVIKESGLELGILIGTPIIRQEIFSIPRAGMINLHQGHIPGYRGIPPAFWEHFNKESEMRVTVNTVARNIDAGLILEERKFSIENHSHPVISKFYANTLSAEMLKNAVEKTFKGMPGEFRPIDKKPNTVPGYRILFRETVKLLQCCLAKDEI